MGNQNITGYLYNKADLIFAFQADTGAARFEDWGTMRFDHVLCCGKIVFLVYRE